MANSKVLALRMAAFLCAAVVPMLHAVAPSAVTLPAQSISSDRATLKATVAANDLATYARFQWGKTTNYELTVAASGFDLPYYWNGELTLLLNPLQPSTTYHYRIVATNSSGFALGADAVFTTGPTGPPTASGGTPTNVTAFSAVLAGTVNPNSLSTKVYFQWGTNTNYTATTVTQTLAAVGVKTPVQQFITNLVANRTYHYRVVASNSAGLTRSADVAFNTLQFVPPTAATAPAVVLTTNAATLNGSVNPGGYAANAAFQWGPTTNYGNTTALIALAAGTGFVPVSTNLNNLVPDTTYHFRVVATNASTAISLGTDYVFTTPLYLPPIVTTTDAVQSVIHSATLHGDVNPNGPPASAWFDWGTTTNYGSRTTTQNIGNGLAVIDVAHTISGLALGATYQFRVVGSNAAGIVRGSNQTFTALLGAPVVATAPATVLPAVPPGLSYPYAYLKGTVMPNNDDTTVYFQWGTNTGYGNILNGPFVPAGTSNVSMSVFLYPLTSDATFHFRIAAYNRAGTNYGGDLTFSRLSVMGPHLQIRREAGGTNAVTCTAEAGRVYALEKTISLNNWWPVATNTAAADGSLVFHVPASGSPSFYRVTAQ